MSGEATTTDFPLVEQGYDPNHVDEYLATQMLQLREELDTARSRAAELEAQLQAREDAADAVEMSLDMARRASSEILEEARAKADDMIGDARRGAFDLMTEARVEADSAVRKNMAQIAAVREEALALVSSVEAETARLIAERDLALEQMREEYEAESTILMERIETLRTIAADLEARTPGPRGPNTSPDSPSPTNEGRAANAPQAGNEPDHDTDGDASNAARIRESFSGRRRAKLPRIGDEAGRSALATATAMRAHMTNGPDDSDQVGHDDLAVRTA